MFSLLNSFATMKILQVATLLLLALVEMEAIAAERKTYIVHVDMAKLRSFYGTMETFTQLHQSLLASVHHQPEEDGAVADKEEAPQLLHSYERAMSGFAARLSAHQLERLKKVDGFIAAIPDRFSKLATTHSPRFLGLQSGKGLWASSNLKSDIIIGVVDSGIWPEHPSFHDAGMPPVPSRWRGSCEKGVGFSPEKHCNRKLIGARFYHQGYEAEYGPVIKNGTGEYISARDHNGHGTHTSSTAAGSVVDTASFFGFANGSASGMMYTARIAMYKACWVEGKCSDADTVAAIEHAIQDGVDVLSLSLGSPTLHYYLDAMAAPFLAAIKNGIFVSTAASNDGPDSASLSNTMPWIMTVAAGKTDRTFPAVVKLGNGRTFHGVSLYSGKPTPVKQVVYGQFCLPESLDPELVKGKIVLCEVKLGYSTLQKSWVVKLAGGAAAILINTKDAGEDVEAVPHIIPATLLGYSSGRAIASYVNSTKSPLASISFQGTTYGNRAPSIPAFSSRGPDLLHPSVLKPDITAPGFSILAAYPITASLNEIQSDRRRSNYNLESGTSMATPHVTGLAALVKSVHKDWSTAAIKSALMTTAYVTDNKGGPILDAFSLRPATPLAMGSGHVDPERAVDPGLIYDIATIDYLYYLCGLGYDDFQMLVFVRALHGTNFSSCDGYEKVMARPGDLNLPSFSMPIDDDAKNFSITYKRTVTNVGTAISTYRVQVQEPAGMSIAVKPNILKFSKVGEKLSYKVRFNGKPTNSDITDESFKASFGSLTWTSGRYSVRSPIAVIIGQLA